MLKLFVFLLINISSLLAADRKSSFPYLAGDTWRFFCDWRLSDKEDFNPKAIAKGDTIFVEYDSLQDFADYYLPDIQEQFILITPNCERGSDNPLPGPFSFLLNSKKVAAWFLQNIDCAPNDKLIPIPIGLANKIWDHGNTTLLDKFIPFSLRIKNKRIFAYVNFAISTCPNERNACWQYFAKQNFATMIAKPISFPKYLEDLSTTVFVISPRGNGLDCHRTWEALLMGCYPVVKHSTLDPLYEELPVVIVNDWQEASFEFLQKKSIEFSSKTWSRDKLYAPYWFKKVRFIQNEIRQRSTYL